MKIPLTLILSALILLTLPACVYDVGYGGGGYPYPNPTGGHHGSNYYNRGVSYGKSDARSGRSNNPDRHLSGVPSSYRHDFRRGYDVGYRGEYRPGGGWPGSGGGHQDASIYRQGESMGSYDRSRGKKYNPSRHYDRVPREYRSTFDRGYDRGYRR